MNKTIRNSIEIAASIKDINEMLPGLKESEIIGYAYNIMARDIANGDLRSTTIWDDLLKLDFGDKKKEIKFAETRGCSINDDDFTIVINKDEANPAAYLNRKNVFRAPLAAVTKLVLYYVRKKLHEQEKSKVNEERKMTVKDVDIVLGELKANETDRLVKLQKYLNLLICTDKKSLEKIKQIDEILKED